MLRGARIAAGLTQAELAERLRRPQSYVAKYETGKRQLDVIEFVEVALSLRELGGATASAIVSSLERHLAEPATKRG